MSHNLCLCGYCILLITVILVFFPVISASTVECENLLATGVAEYNAGDYSSALMVFDLLIQKDPSWPSGWLWKGTVLKDLGEQEEAEKAFKKGRCLLSPDTCTDSGDEHDHDTGDDYKKPLSNVQNRESGPYPPIGYSYIDRSNTGQQADTFDLRSSDTDRTVSSDPQYLEHRGDELMESGLYRQALQSYLLAEQMDPKNPVFPAKAGDAFNQIGDLSSALDAWNRSLSLQPGQDASDILRKKRGDAYEVLNEPEKALDELERIKSLNNPDLFLQKGNLYSVLHEYGRAEDSFQKCLSLDPGNTDASLGLAQAQMSQGKISNTQKTLDSVQKPPLHSNQSRLLEQLKKEMKQYPASDSDDLSFLFTHPELYILIIVGIGGIFYYRDSIFR